MWDIPIRKKGLRDRVFFGVSYNINSINGARHSGIKDVSYKITRRIRNSPQDSVFRFSFI